MYQNRNQILRWLYTQAMVLFVCFAGFTQPIGLDLLKGKEEIEIPFKMQQGLMIVDIKVQNVLPLKFIFDTGAENTILFHKEYSDLIGLEYTKRVKVIGSDFSDDLHALIARSVIISIPLVTSVQRDLLILEQDVYLLQEKLGYNVDGILGGSFFKGMILEIDYKKGMIIIKHPQFYQPPITHVEFDLQIIKNKPYVKAIIEVEKNRQVEGLLLLDTGASLPFLIHSNTDTLLGMPDFVINGNIGHGIGGQLVGFVGKVDRLQLGEFEFRRLLTSFQDVTDVAVDLDKDVIVRNGLLGNAFLSRFQIQIDYLQNKLYIKPRKKYNEEFEFDKSGLTIYAFGSNLKQFIIKNVLPDSPADKVGLLEGDIIVKICRKKAKGWTLEKVNKLLQKKVGTKIKMVVQRDEELIPIEFYLKDLFEQPKKVKPL